MSHQTSLAVVIWDVGGTLVSRVLNNVEIVGRALLSVGVRPEQLQPEAIRRVQKEYTETYLFWRTPKEEANEYRRLATLLLEGVESSADRGRIGRLSDRLAGYFDAYRPVAGIQNLLGELAGHGIRQAVLSNWPQSLRSFLDHHGLSGYFSVIVSSADAVAL